MSRLIALARLKKALPRQDELHREKGVRVVVARPLWATGIDLAVLVDGEDYEVLDDCVARGCRICIN